MKKWTIIAWVLLSASALKAQEINLVDVSSKWYILFYTWPDPNDIIKSTEIYSIGNDTLVNGIPYKKLLSNISLTGFIREDSLGQVYFIADEQNSILFYTCLSNFSTDKEYLLYDFSLKTGDTISFEGEPYFFSVVGDIDSVAIGNNYRKRMQILRYGFDNYDSWIEGIGSDKGLLFPLICPFEWSSYLTCFEQNGEIIYNNGGNSPCIINGVENNVQQGFYEIEIYPNPANSVFSIDFKNMPGEKFILVKDLLGNLLFSDKTSADFYKIEDLNITGIYVIQINYLNNTYYRKIVLYR